MWYNRFMYIKFIKENLKIFFSFFIIMFVFSHSDFLLANYVDSQEISLFLVWLHKSVSENMFDNDNIVQNESPLSLLKSLKEYSSISIISMLEFSAMKEIVMDNYIKDTDKLLIDVWFVMNTLKQDIAILKSDMNDCLSEKSLYDKQFFESINLYDQNYMDESLQKSIAAQNCVWKNRIIMNSKIVLLDQFSYYYDFIKKKYDYILSKRDMIIRNFDFMKNGLLDELVTTKEVLNTLGN